MTGERYSIQIRLAHNGQFGFSAVLSINLSRNNAGLYAKLYYYNGKDLHLAGESEIAANGVAQLLFTHASDYLIVIGERAGSWQPSSEEDKINSSDTDGSLNNNPNTGDPYNPRLIILIAALAILVGAFAAKKAENRAR